MTDHDEKGKEIVCEFFGIQITTKNPNVARVLTADVSELLTLDVQEIPVFLRDQHESGETAAHVEESEPDDEGGSGEEL